LAQDAKRKTEAERAREEVEKKKNAEIKKRGFAMQKKQTSFC